ncbi:MAG: DUF2924 domain-containing protein [Gammaproteobacteria bacterium]|nr:DUF2924 domain-containing protein [Gammaproteobacteria bacterium]
MKTDSDLMNRLRAASYSELRAWYQDLRPDAQIPKRLKANNLIGQIAWLEQAQTSGLDIDEFHASIVKQLSQCNKMGQNLKPGTRLLREWHGQTHQVEVQTNGFAYNGETYNSLSEIARVITGARWSGPRFFGLKGSRRD